MTTPKTKMSLPPQQSLTAYNLREGWDQGIVWYIRQLTLKPILISLSGTTKKNDVNKCYAFL